MFSSSVFLLRRKRRTASRSEVLRTRCCKAPSAENSSFRAISVINAGFCPIPRTEIGHPAHLHRRLMLFGARGILIGSKTFFSFLQQQEQQAGRSQLNQTGKAR